eukprot:1157690-Pelagomonas_calceolata.AAC.4
MHELVNQETHNTGNTLDPRAVQLAVYHAIFTHSCCTFHLWSYPLPQMLARVSAAACQSREVRRGSGSHMRLLSSPPLPPRSPQPVIESSQGGKRPSQHMNI